MFRSSYIYRLNERVDYFFRESRIYSALKHYKDFFYYSAIFKFLSKQGEKQDIYNSSKLLQITFDCAWKTVNYLKENSLLQYLRLKSAFYLKLPKDRLNTAIFSLTIIFCLIYLSPFYSHLKSFEFIIFLILFIILAFQKPLLAVIILTALRIINVRALGLESFVALSLIALLSFLLRMPEKNKIDLVNAPQIRTIAFFIFVAMISSFFAEYQSLAWQEVITDFSFYLLFILLVNLIKTREDIKLFIFSLIIIVVSMVFISIFFRYLTQSGGRLGRGLKYLDSNVIGCYCAIMLPLTFYLFLSSYNKWKKILLFILSLILIKGIILSYSRTAFVLLLLGLIFILLSIKKYRLIIVGLILSFCLLSSIFIPQIYIKRIDTIKTVTKGIYSDTQGVAIRFKLIKAALLVFMNNPILGVGPNNSRKYIPGYLDINTDIPPHNAYVKVMAEMGIIGIITYLYLILYFLRDLVFIKEGLKDINLVCLYKGILIAFLLFLVYWMASANPLEIVFIGSLVVALKNLASNIS